MRALREVVGWVCVGRREKEKGGRVLWAGRDGRGGGCVYWYWMGRGVRKDLCKGMETPENPEDMVQFIDQVGLVRNNVPLRRSAEARKGEKETNI